MSGMSRSARVLLLASLALNIVLGVALLIAAPWSDPPRDGMRGRHGGVFPGLIDPRALRAALGPERQDALDGILQSHREAMRTHLGALFEARRAVRDAIVAEPFDRAALDAAFEDLRSAEAATANEAQALFGDVLAQTSMAERQRLAELMPRRGGGRHRDGERSDDKQDPPRR